MVGGRCGKGGSCGLKLSLESLKVALIRVCLVFVFKLSMIRFTLLGECRFCMKVGFGEHMMLACLLKRGHKSC